MNNNQYISVSELSKKFKIKMSTLTKRLYTQGIDFKYINKIDSCFRCRAIIHIHINDIDTVVFYKRKNREKIDQNKSKIQHATIFSKFWYTTKQKTNNSKLCMYNQEINELVLI